VLSVGDEFCLWQSKVIFKLAIAQAQGAVPLSMPSFGDVSND
jgi:hypothetical protein